MPGVVGLILLEKFCRVGRLTDWRVKSVAPEPTYHLFWGGKRNLTPEMQEKCFDTLEFDKDVCRVLNALISYPSTHHVTRNAGR